MSGISDLNTLLASMSPELMDGEFVFITVSGTLADYAQYNPIAMFQEKEGLTLVLPVNDAKLGGFEFDGIYKQITLMVHSSLEAVGLTAAIATKLTANGINANVIAAYYHDHVFIQKDKADLALKALKEFTN